MEKFVGRRAETRGGELVDTNLAGDVRKARPALHPHTSQRVNSSQAFLL